MRNRSSSFHAEPVAGAGGKFPVTELWPWLLALGPLLVVLASFASAWLALRSDDGVVAQDYYKQGLLINARLKQAGPDLGRQAGATITVSPAGALHAHVEGFPADGGPLQIRVVRPGERDGDETVTLVRSSDSDYAGHVNKQLPGRWIMTMESGRWQLPTTTGVGRIAELKLGALASPANR